MTTKLTDEKVVKEAFTAFTAHWEEEAPHEDLNKIDEWTGKPDFRSGATAFEMIAEYVALRRSFFESPDFQLIEIEKPFAVPLNDDPNGPIYVGRLDKVFKYQDRVYIGEHKTTSSYKKEGPFRNDFTDSFSPNSQVDGYLYAGHLLYDTSLKAVWVDAALVHAAVHDGFRFLPVERQFQQLAAWHWETLYWVNQIEANKAALMQPQTHEFMAAFPKNTSQCTNFNNCPYMGCCKMLGNPSQEIEPGSVPLGYTLKKWEPFDAEALMSAGLNDNQLDRLYDNTRISSFRNCARSFYYRHVLDMSGDGTSRALLFGGSWHAAMDKIWEMLAA